MTKNGTEFHWAEVFNWLSVVINLHSHRTWGTGFLDIQPLFNSGKGTGKRERARSGLWSVCTNGSPPGSRSSLWKLNLEAMSGGGIHATHVH